MNTALIIWIALLAVFVIVEAATAQLVTIWFALGAFAALIAAILDAEVWLQLTVFVVVSAIALAATRPIVKKLKSTPKQATNADRLIGQQAIVTEDIDNVSSQGRVQVSGMSWAARSENGESIARDTVVTVEKIDGVKLIVK